MLHILVIEDDLLVQSSLKLLLKGHRMEFYSTVVDYLTQVSESRVEKYDLVLVDLCHPKDKTGEGTLLEFPKLRALHPQAEIFIESGVSEIPVMKRCLKMGADRFILKEHLADEVPLLLESFVDLKKTQQRIDEKVCGDSQSMRQLKKQLLLLAKNSQLDCLIEGETGTGKEVCAQVIAGDKNFVAVNVSALSKELFEAELFGAEKGAYTGSVAARTGYFESTDSGTLFLDEIQSLDLALQAKLLRVLESRQFSRVGSTQVKTFHGRVLAASNENLKLKVEKGEFREDLYFRLAQTKVLIPPLRLRGEDVLLLAKIFLTEFDKSGKIKFSDSALKWISQEYDWPGNVRELKAVIKRLVVESKMPFLDAEDFSSALGQNERLGLNPLIGAEVNSQAHSAPTSLGAFQANPDMSFDENVYAFEAHYLNQVLASTANSQDARGKLKLSRTRFYEKLRAYQLTPKG